MKKAAYYVLLAALIGVFAFSAYKVGSYLWEKHKSDQVTQEAAKYVQVEKTEDAEPEMITVDFDALREVNSDVIAWIYCPDTQINYPVVQGPDNDYYLSHLLDGSYNANGTIFMDYHGAADFSDANNILYGHHMKTGAMFANLIKYKDPDFYEKHPCMYLFTPQQNYRLDLFAGLVVEADDDIYFGDVTMEQLQRCVSRSTFTAQTDIPAENPIVTLSTCSYEFDDARYIVLAELVPIEE